MARKKNYQSMRQQKKIAGMWSKHRSQSDLDRLAIIKLIERITVCIEKQTKMIEEKGKRDKKTMSEAMAIVKTFYKKVSKP